MTQQTQPATASTSPTAIRQPPGISWATIGTIALSSVSGYIAATLIANSSIADTQAFTTSE